MKKSSYLKIVGILVIISVVFYFIYLLISFAQFNLDFKYNKILIITIVIFAFIAPSFGVSLLTLGYLLDDFNSLKQNTSNDINFLNKEIIELKKRNEEMTIVLNSLKSRSNNVMAKENVNESNKEQTIENIQNDQCENIDLMVDNNHEENEEDEIKVKIEDNEFWGDIFLVDYKIPKSISSIGIYAFKDCAFLESITIPTTVTEIGAHAFEGCKKLSKVYYNGSKEQWNAINIGIGNQNLLDAQLILK